MFRFDYLPGEIVSLLVGHGRYMLVLESGSNSVKGVILVTDGNSTLVPTCQVVEWLCFDVYRAFPRCNGLSVALGLV